MSTISGDYSYRDYLNQYKYEDTTSGTPETSGSNQVWNMVVDDEGKNGISIDDFLTIMVTQLTNQDFMNPVDDTQFVTQLAQFSTLQQMQEMSSNMKSNYMLSLVGKTVTCAKFNVSGNLQKETGPIERIVLANDEFALYVNGEKFSLSQIMELHETGEEQPPSPEDDGSGEEEDASAAETL